MLGTGAEQLLQRLEWTVLKRLDGLLQGNYRTLLRGTGMDLADLREYQLHDDVRHIDWNVTARQHTPHVRVFTEDREMAAWFVLDLSPSVDFGSGARRKRDTCADFVAVLARLLTRHGNRVGAVLYGSAEKHSNTLGINRVLPPGASRLHVLHLLGAIQARPDWRGQHQGASTRLDQLVQAGATLFKRRCTVFVVSDFFSEPGWEKPLGQLAQRHDVVAVRLIDPMERQLPDLGLLPMVDAESGEQILVDTSNAAFRKRFAALSEQREAVLRQSLMRAGVDTLELCTDDDLADALLRFATLRQHQNRRRTPQATHHSKEMA